MEAKQKKIALAGNPNSGKTTLFNALTGANQFVGNWPGVTVEKKEGRLKKHGDVTIVDLPGVYSLSPYTLEEVVARNFLIGERPDAILNIVDGSNLERNLYLTTQLTELGIPVVVAINMIDVVRRNGDVIETGELSRALGCPVLEISALRGDGVAAASEAAVHAAEGGFVPQHRFCGAVERALAHIEEAALHDCPAEQRRWYAVKVFERDEKVLEQLSLEQGLWQHIEEDIAAAEEELDDDAESIITNERYIYVTSVLRDCYRKKHAGLSVSDQIDRVVTNRWAALPIFAAVMFLVYFLSITTVGTIATDWVNDGVFGEGWHLFGIGSAAYEEASEEYAGPAAVIEAFEALAAESGRDPAQATDLTAVAFLYNDEGNVEKTLPVTFADYERALLLEEPDPSAYGVWIPSIPALLGGWLEGSGCAKWLQNLLLDGIVGGVGAVLGFVPQLLILFLFLAFLESCGYMARIAFVMDRLFRKFGLSGKSFIPMLIGTGCGVPGIMASRTIENDRDRRMTIMTTTFIPCGAKLPIIALIAGALFGGAWWVAPSAYFIGIASIVVSGILLKKTRWFSGDPAPFVMELPAYHWPTAGNVLRSVWERGWSFIKKAGTIILLSTIVLWFLQSFGFEGDSFGMVEDLNNSLLAIIGSSVAWLFMPLGWGHWQGAVASITGLIAKENVVGTFGVLFGGFDEVAENGWQIWSNMRTAFSPLAAYSFLVFNLLCAPCFAAMGALRREMSSAKWTAFAIGYQCVFAYAAALIIYQLGLLFTGQGNLPGSLTALAVASFVVYLLVRPAPQNRSLKKTVRL